ASISSWPITVTACPVSSISVRVPVAVTVIEVSATPRRSAKAISSESKSSCASAGEIVRIEIPDNRYLYIQAPTSCEHVAHGGTAPRRALRRLLRYTPPGAERRVADRSPGSPDRRPAPAFPCLNFARHSGTSGAASPVTVAGAARAFHPLPSG